MRFKLLYFVCFLLTYCSAFTSTTTAKLNILKKHEANRTFLIRNLYPLATSRDKFSHENVLVLRNSERNSPQTWKEFASSDTFISFLLSLSYMSIIVTVMALPCTLMLVSIDPVFVQKGGAALFSSIVALATLATMGGKFLLAVPTDYFGGDLTLRMTMAVMALMLYTCSITSSVKLFYVSWVMLSFVYATAWGAVGVEVRSQFQKDKWGSQLSLIAASSRLGSLCSSLFFGSILRESGSVSLGTRGEGNWRNVFKYAFYCQSFILGVYMIGRNIFNKYKKISNIRNSSIISNEQEKRDDDVIRDPMKYLDVGQVLSLVFQMPTFWYMLVSKTSLFLVGQWIGFIPMFLKTSVGLSPSKAAMYSGVFALGSLLSSIVGSIAYSKWYVCVSTVLN